MAGNENANGRWNNSSSIGRTLLNDAVFKERNGETSSSPVGREPSVGSISQSSLQSQDFMSQNRPSIFGMNGNTSRDTKAVQNLQRKRTRIGEGQDNEEQSLKVEELLKRLQTVIDQIIKKGDKGKSILDKINLTELFKDLCMSFVSCLSVATNASLKMQSLLDEKEKMVTKIENCLDEKVALQQQIIELQLQVSSSSSSTTPTYLQAAMKESATKIAIGKSLPIPIIPEAVRHAPSEHVLLFRDKEKGIMKSKKEQETFRKEIKDAIGDVLAKRITVIRPTRFGGYTVIFSNEESRDAALKILRQNEMLSNIDVKSSCITAPKKKQAKAVCREPPIDCSPDDFLSDMYSFKNPQMQHIPSTQREVRIITSSTIGWIFEYSSAEAAACYAQNGRIRYDYGREAKLEEFIPLQQCYKCCAFGHNADDCTSNMAFCRLCGAAGHAGKDCQNKDNKELWKCINCKITNEAKGYNLPTDHGAAQLHKCPCALNQKMIRKEQLAAAGVFTTPVTKDTMINKIEQQSNSQMQLMKNGLQQIKQGTKDKEESRATKHRSRSLKKKMQNIARINSASPVKEINDFQASTSSSSSSSSSKNKSEQASEKNQIRSFRISRPRSTEGWKIAGQNGDMFNGESRGRGREEKVGGTSSTSNLPEIENSNNDTLMQ